jgi:hypothetical protein
MILSPQGWANLLQNPNPLKFGAFFPLPPGQAPCVAHGSRSDVEC